MFFGLVPIDHPCCKMQEVVESFFLNSIVENTYSLNLFPPWIRATIGNANSTLNQKFSAVYDLLHAGESNAASRQQVYDQLRLTNQIEELCNGTQSITHSVIVWISPLGIAIIDLMEALYKALDLAVFRKNGQIGQPTHQFYSDFIDKNNYVCPFCGIESFKNKRGARREDFDHYLNKARYPLAAANMNNLVPTCGTCNQDYKKCQDMLADGFAFYPYDEIPEVKVAIDCDAYPATTNFSDHGSWVVNVELVTPDDAVAPKLAAWNRVYSIQQRLENEVKEFSEEWMREVSDGQPHILDKNEFTELVRSAKTKARERAQRRIEPKQIVKEAFYEFILNKARGPFIESFRRLRNERYT